MIEWSWVTVQLCGKHYKNITLTLFAKYYTGSLVPRLSPRANEKSKERGEPGRIYHVRNVIGREDLITCGRTNELAHAVRTEYSCDSFMADRMGLDGTLLHYLVVRKAMVSVHKPIHSKITLTYSLTWQVLPGEWLSRRY